MKHLNSLREHAESFVEHGNNRTDWNVIRIYNSHELHAIQTKSHILRYIGFPTGTCFALFTFIRSFIRPSFIRSFTHSFIFSFFHSFTRLFIHYFIHSSFIYKDDSPDVSAHIYQTTRRHFPENSHRRNDVTAPLLKRSLLAWSSFSPPD